MQAISVKHEVLGDNYTVEIKEYRLVTGVTLRILDGKEAVIKIHGDEINFAWNHETEHAFQTLDNVTGMELLRIIARASL